MSDDWKTVFHHGEEAKRAGQWGVTLSDDLQRYPVEGGWLYRNTIKAKGKPDVLAMTFVPASKEEPADG